MAQADVLHRLIGAMNTGDLAALKLLLASTYIDHDVYYGEPDKDREGFLAFVQTMRAAFPDFRIEFEDEAMSGDRVWGRFTASATMRGAFMGQPPTGKSATWIEMHEVRFDPATGLILEHWGAGADLSMLTQMGLLPALKM